jgi:hypothetical protein
MAPTTATGIDQKMIIKVMNVIVTIFLPLLPLHSSPVGLGDQLDFGTLELQCVLVSLLNFVCQLLAVSCQP